MLRRVLLSFVVLASMVAPSAAPAVAQTSETEITAQSIDTDAVTARVGLVDPATGIWFLRGRNGVVGSFFYGNPGDVPFAGDWNCDGIDTPGLYRQSDGFVYLRNSNTQGPADIRFFFGNPGDFPLAGDFNDDGCDTVSIYRASESRIYVINELGANDGGLGAADFNYVFGNPGDKPFVGDFDGDGISTVGLHRESTGFVYFRNSHTQGIADDEFFFGDPGDRLIAGDWGDIDGDDTPAVFRPSNTTFYFRHTNSQGNADQSLVWGTNTYLPIAGNWGTVTAGGPGGPGGPQPPAPPAPLAIGPSIPRAVVEVPYSAQLAISGGTPPYTVTKLSGPIWASVSTKGLVTGTPLAPASAHLQVRARDSKGVQVTAAIVLTVINKCDGVTAVPALQCQALAALYNQTNGNGWADRTGWFVDPNICTGWVGISCNGANISVIRLNENLLNGTLPAEMANLTGLQQLDLMENSLSGSLPLGLFGITTLQTVILSHNAALGGPFPEFTTPLSSLTRLSLDSMGGALGAIPTSMTAANLPNLTELALDEAGLGGPIPSEFFSVPWPDLASLRLDENQLNGNPTGFNSTNFPSLTRLELNANPWAGIGGQTIPAEIGTLSTLTVLDLSEANFTGAIPTGADGFNPTGFPSMTSLTLCGNLGLTATNPSPEFTFVSTLDPSWNLADCP